MSGGGSFQDLLGEYEAPTDYDIVLPGKVGEAAGNKGGANTPSTPAATTPAGTPAESHPAGTSQEPAPELPEGSDEDEASAAAAAEEERAREELQRAQEATQPEADELVEGTGQSEVASFDPGPDSQPTGIDSGSASQTPMRPMVSRKGTVLAFEGEHSHLKHFPKALIEVMRELLTSQLGVAPVRDLSQNSIVTAFVIAALGVDFQTDEATAEAVEAFRSNDPKTNVIEKRTAALLEQQIKTEVLLKQIVEKLGDVADTSAVLEMGQAYALAERTALLNTTGVLPESIDVTQKRAVASRDNIRTRVKKLQSEEKVRNGRPIR